MKGQDVGFKAKQISTELENNHVQKIDLSAFDELAKYVEKREVEKQFEKLGAVLAEREAQREMQPQNNQEFTQKQEPKHQQSYGMSR